MFYTVNYYTLADIFDSTYDKAVDKFKQMTQTTTWKTILGSLASDNTIFNLMNQYVLPHLNNMVVDSAEGEDEDGEQIANVKKNFTLRLAS